MSALQDLRVLVVENDEMSAALLQMQLVHSGALVVGLAASVAEALRLLEEESVLVVPGSSFNVPRSRHFRLTLLPSSAQLHEVFARIERVLARMAGEQPLQSAGVAA